MKPKLYLAWVKLSKGDQPIESRLREHFPMFEKTVKSISNNRYHLAFRSAQGDTFAWVLATELKSREIVAELENPGATTQRDWRDPRSSGGMPSPSQMKDVFLVFELGSDYCDLNSNVLTAWMDHQKKSL